MDDSKFIDVEKVLKEKSPSLYKWLPGFLVNWLKRKLHEEEINEAMIRNKDTYGLNYNSAAIRELGVKVEAAHTENIPEKGGIIIASNHPLGGLDGLALINAVSGVRKDIRFIVNDILQKLKNFGDLFVGVNKVGANSRDALKTIEDVYSSDAAILVFPAGLVSRKQNGVIKDLEWNKSFVSKAIKYQKTIVPVYVEGKNSDFFYNLSLWRKRLGIKGNIEMLFLPDEMFRQKGKMIRVHFGKPFSYTLLDNSRSHQEWANLIKQYIYSESFKKNNSFEEFLSEL